MNTPPASTHSEALFVSAAGGLFANDVTVDSASSNQSASLYVFGEIAANAGDVVLDADGVVSLQGRISASNDVAVETTADGNMANPSAADLQFFNGALTAGNDLTLNARSGSIATIGGQLYSFDNLAFNSLSYIDSASSVAAEFNNSRYAKNDLSLNIAQSANLTGTTWKASDLSISGTSLAITTGAGVVMNAADTFDIAAQSLENSGTLASDDASDFALSSSVTNHTTGIIQSNQSSVLSTPTLTNYGSWITSQTDTATGGATWRVTTLNNQRGATIASADTWSLNDMTNSGNGSLTNQGTIASDVAFNATLASASNQGSLTLSLQNSSATSTWAVDSLTNTSDGTLFAGGNWIANSTSSRGSSLSQSGIMQGYSDLYLGFDGLSIASDKNISGALDGASTFSLDITNAQTLQALIFSGADLVASFDGGLEVSDSASISALNDADIIASGSGSDILNYGFLYAGNDLAINAADRFGNFTQVSLSNGRTLGTSSVNGRTYREQNQTLLSSAEVRAGNDLDITAGNLLVNSSELRASADLSLTAPTISNQPQRTSNDGFSVDRPLTMTVAKKLNYSRSQSSNRYYDFPDDKEDIKITQRWNEFNYYTDGAPAKDPMILAGSYQLNGATITNYGGLIEATGSAGSNINATTSFTNDSLALIREDWKWVQERKIHWIAAGPAKYSDSTTGAYPSAGVPAPLDAGSAVVTAANALNVTGEELLVVGSFTTDSSSNSTGSVNALNPNGFSLNVSLPSNPNGFFVTNRDPSALYLVEMNPKLQAGVSTLGSDYLLENLGVDNDSTLKRLGSASYEAYLVEQQLIEQTGSALLDGFDDMADVMSRFFDNAVNASTDLGLEIGTAPTAEQLAQLDAPIVWMVETVVEGITVLAPQVYLPASTQRQIAAVLSGNDLNIDVATLDNLGGEIAADESLSITAEGDINNISGTIRGGDVSVTSTQGSINNETFNQFAGNELVGQTTIGNTASIQATGNLELDAAENITNLGAEIAAGGDANLQAGNEIRFDTIEDRTNTFEVGPRGSGIRTSSQRTTQIGSGLNVGGDLSASTDTGDITFANTQVEVAGNADIDSAGDINIIDREDSFETQFSQTTSGVGVGGGGFMGTVKQTIETTQIRSQGSEFNVGGDTNLDAEGDLLIRGSELNLAGDAQISANSVAVLDGRNVDARNERT